MNIFGASGHGKVVIDVVRSNKERIHYVLDDNPAITTFLGYEVLHQVNPDVIEKSTMIAIGNNEIRKRIAKSFPGPISEAFVHKSAVVASTVSLGEGSVVMAQAVINSDSVIGKHCIVNTGAVVEHDCILKDYVHISPKAALAGGVTVEEGSQIGIGAVVIPGIKIGQWATVGAGTVVIEDVPDFATVVGNPGKVIKIRKEQYE